MHHHRRRRYHVLLKRATEAENKLCQDIEQLTQATTADFNKLIDQYDDLKIYFADWLCSNFVMLSPQSPRRLQENLQS